MKALFITYNGALEPLLQSQGIAYLKGLSKNNLEFVLLSFEKKYNLNKYKSEEIKEIEKDLNKHKIEWRRLIYHKNPPIVSTIYDIFTGCFYCTYLIFKKKINIIHARSYVPAVIAYILKKCFNIKFIFDMRGMMIDEYADAQIFKKEGFLYKFGKIVEKKLLLSANWVIVLTTKIKDTIKDFSYLQDRKDLKIEAIPCCIDLKKFTYVSQKKEFRHNAKLMDKFIFVYTGSVGTWYFLEGILDFFAVAKSKIPKVHFLFINQESKNFIKNAILKKKFDLGDFTIIGTEHDRVPYYISECDAGIVFYQQTFSRLACCPIKFGEYLACGVPVILNSGIGDTEEIVTINRIGGVVREFTRECYEDAIDELLNVRKEGVLLRQRCRGVAEELLSLECGIAKYSDIYKNMEVN